MLRRGAYIEISRETMARLMPEKQIRFPYWEWTGVDMKKVTAKESEPVLQELLKALDLEGGQIHSAEFRYENDAVFLLVEHPRLPVTKPELVTPTLTVQILQDVVVLT